MTNKKNELITYEWEGVNKRGEKIKGSQEARSIAIVKADLRKQGIITKRVLKQRAPLFSKGGKKIVPGDIAVFSRQMSTMMQAGIPLLQSFDIVSKGQANEKMAKLIDAVKLSVQSGLSLSESLKKHPDHFNELYCNLVEAGEQSGSLETMLDNVATYQEKVESIKKKIKKALFYPIAVMVIAFLVSACLLIFVVPQFEDLFNGFGADLPALTRFVIDLSEIFQAYWYLMFGLIIGLGWLFGYGKKHSPQFCYFLDRVILKFPIIGPIIEKAAIARFSRTLSITFAAGMPLVEALKCVAGATGNILFAQATDEIRENVSTGQQMQLAMKNTKMFPNMVIQMVAIGEESGALENMLTKVADFYEEDVDNAVDALSSLIEPMIMAVLGVMVGGLVVAMYLPIFKLGAVV